MAWKSSGRMDLSYRRVTQPVMPLDMSVLVVKRWEMAQTENDRYPWKYLSRVIRVHFMNPLSKMKCGVDKLRYYPLVVMAPWVGLERNTKSILEVHNSFGCYSIVI